MNTNLNKFTLILLSIYTFLSLGFSQTKPCNNSRDSYFRYNKDIRFYKPDSVKTEYYMVYYNWSPDYCKKSGIRNRPGQRDFIQCSDQNSFHYVLEKLAPRGSLTLGNAPEYCEGDQPQINRSLLENYLCMTPSMARMQKAYEQHGTCMHDESLETPEQYLKTSFSIHQGLVLPTKKLSGKPANYAWFYKNNPALQDSSVVYKNRSWGFCFDRSFKSVTCPNHEFTDKSKRRRSRHIHSTIKTVHPPL